MVGVILFIPFLCPVTGSFPYLLFVRESKESFLSPLPIFPLKDIPCPPVLYSALLSMFSHAKVPVVIRFFSFSAWLSMTARLRRGVFLT